MASSSTTPKFEVFISHAGEDKATMAIPLREMLQKNGITAFVDEEDMPPGVDAKQEMISAMETAYVGVIILSPEFVAKEWPMKELLCFLKRRDDALLRDASYPVIIPLFYRLSISELYHEPRLGRKGADGKDIYQASRFFDRMKRDDPEADIQTIKNALMTLRGIMGVRNDVDATNGSEYVMRLKREFLLQRTCDAIVQALGKQNKTTTAYSLVSDFARGAMDLVVYSGKALIAHSDRALLRVQEALIARVIADCSECLRLLGSKTWYFCGSTTLPAFVVKMALINQPQATRRKIVDRLLSLSRFRIPKVILEFRWNNMWDATTMMDVSFVNALIFKNHYGRRSTPSTHGKARFANKIISELNISALDMLLVLQTMRLRFFAHQDPRIVLNGEQGLGWYRVVFILANGASEFRLEYICSLEIPGGGTNSSPHMKNIDMKDIMILNFLHTAVIPPEARKLKERKEGQAAWMETSLACEGNIWEGEKSIFDSFDINTEDRMGNRYGPNPNGDGAYTELLEISCIHTLRASYHARCQSYVDSLVENVDERQLVVSNAGGNRHMLIRQGREISFRLLAEEFGMSVMKDAEEGKLVASCPDLLLVRHGRTISFEQLAREIGVGVMKNAEERKLVASCHGLYEYGRFCAQGEVAESWYELLVPTVANNRNVNFAQAALTGRGSYTKFVAQNMSVRLKDSILLCDPASDSIAVAFDGVSELSSSLKVRISELMETNESERLRASFFICRGAVRTRRSISTRMLDVMRSRYTGLEGIGRISAKDVTEDLDESELRVVVECMESLAVQGGYRENSRETSLFAALCSSRECEKTIVVTGVWPSLEGKFYILQDGNLYKMKLEYSSKTAIVASRHAGIYRTQRICQVPESTDPVDRFESSEEVVVVL